MNSPANALFADDLGGEAGHGDILARALQARLERVELRLDMVEAELVARGEVEQAIERSINGGLEPMHMALNSWACSGSSNRSNHNEWLALSMPHQAAPCPTGRFECIAVEMPVQLRWPYLSSSH